MNEDPSLRQLTVTPEEHGLKDLTEQQLFDNLMNVDPEWTDEQRNMVGRAYQLARMLHADDEHRDLPYTYHLLRNANRITMYLHITDPETIAAALLHDSVEDHPDQIMQFALFGTRQPPVTIPVIEDPIFKQQVALKHIEALFSPRTSEIVSGMTNVSTRPEQKLSKAEKLQVYLDHIEEAVADTGVWINKLVDWSDNGLGIVHSDFTEDPSREEHFRTKYGSVLPILEVRYREADIQAMLDPVAKANVERMFELARDRLAS